MEHVKQLEGKDIALAGAGKEDIAFRGKGMVCEGIVLGSAVSILDLTGLEGVVVLNHILSQQLGA